MGKDRIRNYKKGNATFWTCVVIFVCALTLLLVYIFSSMMVGDSCGDCYHLEGYFSAIKNNGTFIVVNGYDYFISDWFRVDGTMPYYINDYVGHNVSIDYYAGCGRRYITSFELVN